MCKQQSLSVDAACKLFGHSRQAYYKSKTDHAERRRRELVVLDTVREIRAQDTRIGGYKLWLMVRDIFPSGWVPGRDGFFKLLSCNHLTLPRAKPRHTTNSNHRFHKYANLYKEVVPMRPNEVWVADITYVDIGNDDCYLHLITDAYSRKILGWVLSDSLSAVNTKGALLQAIGQAERDDLHDVIHHSDRGTQYCCDLYVSELRKHNIMISMTEDSNPTDNGIAERINGIVKQELIYPRKHFESMEEATEKIGAFIQFYNERRPHMSLGMQTPAAVHAGQTGEQKRCWKLFREKNGGSSNEKNCVGGGAPPPTQFSVANEKM